jgi:nickel-dependent lactate racemase
VKIGFPYKHFEQIEPAEVPDANLMGVFEPRALGEGEDPQNVLKKGFAVPIGAPKLRDIAKSDDRILVLTDDYTRGTPVPKVLPHVLEELEAAGVKDQRISPPTAQGTHREMTEPEVMEKLGPYFGRFPVHQHRWLDESSLHRFGTLSDGTPVTANKLLAEHTLVLGIVPIVPHRVKGFSGGSKVAFPGVSGPEMQSKTQWEGAQRMSETIMGVPDNPMRLQSAQEIRLMVESGQVDDVVGASILADNCQIIESHDCIMVSPGVTIEEKRRLNIRHAPTTVQEALVMAFEKQGKHAQVAVLCQGGHILPLVAGESKASDRA